VEREEFLLKEKQVPGVVNGGYRPRKEDGFAY
jgi:hypothetical protein